jgi:vacuolar protein sorting-associated protein 72
MIPYADVRGYKEIEAMLQNRYVWSEGGFWVGGEEDLSADGVEEVEGWREAIHGGWMGGFAIPPEEEEEEPIVIAEEEVVVEEQEPEVVVEPVKKGKKRSAKPPKEAVKPTKGKKQRK